MSPSNQSNSGLIPSLSMGGVTKATQIGLCVLCNNDINKKDYIRIAESDTLARRWYHLTCLEDWVKVQGIVKRSVNNSNAARRRRK